jgi:aminopeptidase-like protein
LAGIDWDRVPPDEEVGAAMHELMTTLFPIMRSLSGDGVRQTLALIGQRAPLNLTEVPTGTAVLDWKVPKEWNVRSAWIERSDGSRVLDLQDTNLHVLGYSVPVDVVLPLAQLREHIFTDPDRPDVVPYRTSYYTERWGFCMSDSTLESLVDGDYHAVIDSTLEDGSLTYGECVLDGAVQDEVLLSTYICHPQLANDNLSGIVLLAALAEHLSGMQLRYTYRLLFGPATIGPIAWLAANEPHLDRIRHGLVASCVGDPGPFTYKRSRRGDAEVDRACEHVLVSSGEPYSIRDWIPWGGDERQFGSPGFNLPVGVLSRTPADEFPEYHSSADDLDFVRPEALGRSFRLYLQVLDVLERDATYVNLNPKGEPQLGRRGLYRSIGGGSSRELALLWVLNQSDGSSSLLDIARRSRLPFSEIREAADSLLEHDLLAEARR